MGSNLTNFESGVKAAVDGFELPYDPQGWEDLELRLNDVSQSSTSNFLIVALVAASVFIASGTYLYFAITSGGYEGMIAEQSVQIKQPFSNQNLNRISFDDIDAATLNGITIESETDSADVTNSELNSDDSSSKENLTNNQSSTVGELNSNNSNAELKSVQQNTGTTDVVTNKGDASSDGSASNGNNSNDDGTANGLMDEEEAMLAFVPSITEACQGVTVDFKLSANAVEGSYLWNFGDGHFSSDPNPAHTYAKPGSYDISLSVTSKTDGQMRSTTKEELIVINPKPEAEFDWEFINGPGEIPQVQFTNTSVRANECEWIFDTTEGTKNINPEHSYIAEGRHEVKLTVTNDYGCVDEKYAYIYIDDNYNLGAAKSFSPNGDNYNDTFLPDALSKNDHQFKLTVYDGMQPIFETTSKKNPWDGSLPSGDVAVAGSAYPWVVIIYNSFGEEEKYFSGTITIIP